MVAVPNKHYLQIFARHNNLRPNMVCVGNQLKNPEIKEEDMNSQLEKERDRMRKE